jgi:hypothetical protein
MSEIRQEFIKRLAELQTNFTEQIVKKVSLEDYRSSFDEKVDIG